MNKMKKILLILSILILSSCALLQENKPQPQNYSPQINQTIVLFTAINQTNSTPPPPPEPVLLPVKEGLAVYVLDTHKKGTIIATLSGKSLLINSQGGSDGLRVLKTLKNLGVNQLTYFIITNDEDDNIDGVTPILLRMIPYKVIHSGIPSPKSAYNEYVKIYPNITIVPYDTLFGFQEAIVNLIVPYDDKSGITGDNSIIVKLTYGDVKFLFATDCKVDCESRISDVISDILISNGGCDSLSYSLLQQVNPEFVVFAGNIPCQETLDRVKSLDIKYLITINDGDAVITSDGIKYEYKNLKS
ncbi:MAG: hypothetical protein AABY22_34500 [Nanoarchaeota archaeon]